MLEVEKIFAEESPLDVLTDLSVIINRHPVEDRMILNYNQLDSPKNHPIVKECRGLTLTKSGKLLAKSFNRFFNLGELQDDPFNWGGPVDVYDKEDGSLVLLYYFNGDWVVQTRGSFADHEIGIGLPTWRSVIWDVLNRSNFSSYEDKLREASFSLELCSPYNQVVKIYKEPTLFLLTGFTGEYELEQLIIDEIASVTRLPRPAKHTLYSVSDIQKHIESQHQTYEGVVVRDELGNRLKIKSATYLALHRLSNNKNVVHPKNLIPLILRGELDEVVSYFPYVKGPAMNLVEKIRDAEKEINDLWAAHKDLETRKDFALAVKHSKWSPALFKSYTDKSQPILTEDLLLKNI